jgi:DEAD/DEAH box helicase domain-containing protein
MLRGKVDAPGCWVDASAVLVRQYLAYCFDCAVKNGVLLELPATGIKLIPDIDSKTGH